MPLELSCSVRGWGTVENPLNDGERIPIEDGVLSVDDADVARALESEYDPLTLTSTIEDDEDEGEPEGSDLPDRSDDEWKTIASEYDFEDVNGRHSPEKIQDAYLELAPGEQDSALGVLDD
jgi:hypothetical protein